MAKAEDADVEVLRGDLRSALAFVGPAVATKDYVPAMTCALFKDDKVFAFNEIIGRVSPCRLNYRGAFGIRHGPLAALVENSSGQTVRLWLAESSVRVRVGRTSAELPMLVEKDFAWQGDPELRNGVTVNKPGALKDQLEAACLGADRRAAELDYASLWLYHLPREGLVGYSTNGTCLSQRRIGLTMVNVDQFPLTVPVDWVAGAVDVLKMSSDKAQAVVLFGKKAVAIRSAAGHLVWSKVLRPDMQRLDLHKVASDHAAEAGKRSKWFGLPAGFDLAVKRNLAFVGHLGADEAAQVAPCRMSIEDGRLTLTSESPASRLRDTFRLAGDVPDGVVNVNLNGIRAALPLSKEACVTKDALFLRDEGGRFLYVTSNLVA